MLRPPPARRIWTARAVCIAAGVLLGIGGLFAPPVRAQPLRMTRADGLPSDYAQALFQDRAGFFWVGTDAGIARIDGRRVETFTVDDGLPHHYLYGIAEDDRGVLWASTFAGLARFDGHRWHADGPATRGQSLIASPVGLIATRGDSLWQRTGGRWRGHALPRGARTNSYDVPWPLADGSVLFGGVRLFHNRPPVYVASLCDGIASGGAHTVFVPVQDGICTASYASAGPGEAWVRTAPDRVVRVRATVGAGGEVRYAAEEGVPLGRAGVRIIRRVGTRLFVTTASDSLLVVDTSTGVQNAVALPARAQALWADYEGAVWVATFGGGIVRVDLAPPVRLAAGRFVRLVAAPDGGVYASGPGLWRTDAAATRAAFVAPLDQARAVAPVPGGGVIVSSGADAMWMPSGVNGRRGATLRGVMHEQTWIAGLDIRGDTLYSATYGAGVLRLVPWQRPGGRIDTLRGVPSAVTEDLVRLRSGLWVLTRSAGAVRLGAAAVVRGRAEGLPSSSVFSLFEDADGARWYGTERGIAREDAATGRLDVFESETMRGQRIVGFRTARWGCTGAWQHGSAPVCQASDGRRTWRVGHRRARPVPHRPRRARRAGRGARAGQRRDRQRRRRRRAAPRARHVRWPLRPRSPVARAAAAAAARRPARGAPRRPSRP